VALRKPLVDPSGPTPLRADWCKDLPKLCDDAVTLRELRRIDAKSLVEHLYRPEVLRFITPCPSTHDGFVRFIRWAQSERRRGGFACYGIVPTGKTVAVGVIQFWPIERDFSTAEWGFALGREFWGTGLFMRSARLALDGIFLHLGVERLEARAVDVNVIGNRALARLGATREGNLRNGFRNGVTVRDHVMWSILASEWQQARNRTSHAN
jgi:ribosomal-protein-alanine N-acetyltransferase